MLSCLLFAYNFFPHVYSTQTTHTVGSSRTASQPTSQSFNQPVSQSVNQYNSIPIDVYIFLCVFFPRFKFLFVLPLFLSSLFQLFSSFSLLSLLHFFLSLLHLHSYLFLFHFTLHPLLLFPCFLCTTSLALPLSLSQLHLHTRSCPFNPFILTLTQRLSTFTRTLNRSSSPIFIIISLASIFHARLLSIPPLSLLSAPPAHI